MPPTILIGANDPNITYLLQRYAEESGFQVAHVCQSEEVLGLASRLQPSLIILDIEILERAERQVLRQLKAEPATCHIPVVIYSYLDEPREDWAEPVDGYLYKSVMYDDFVAVLKQARPAGRGSTEARAE